MKKENIVVAFSGGRTSAFMCYWLEKYMSHLYNFIYVYANTGLEHEKTLEFVDKVDKYLNLNLTWVEAVISKKQGVGTNYKIVDFESACRDNAIFKDMCSVYGLMNKDYIHCTRELKNIPMAKYGKDTIGKHRIALGIRHDEFSRVKNREDAIYPLATITKITKQEILDWWKKQPFDLDLEEHYGNCVGCYKKNHRKLKMIADESPEYFNPFIELENNYELVNTKEEKGARQIYRYNRTAEEVKNNIKYPENIPEEDDCAEECGSIFSDYVSKRAEARLF